MVSVNNMSLSDIVLLTDIPYLLRDEGRIDSSWHRQMYVVDHKFLDCDWSNSSREKLRSRWPGSRIGHEWVAEARKMRRQLELNWQAHRLTSPLRWNVRQTWPTVYGFLTWEQKNTNQRCMVTDGEGAIPGHDFQSYRVTKRANLSSEAVWLGKRLTDCLRATNT
jgi:hypothetical protein